MKIRKKSNRSKATISTASLPDIIFMLLFFFMTVTVMRKEKLLVRITLPNISEVQKLKHKERVNYIHLGHPLSSVFGNQTRIQINDRFVNVDEVEKASLTIVGKLNVHKDLITTALKVNESTDMGIVSDVKQELRKAEIYNLSYIGLKVETLN